MYKLRYNPIAERDLEDIKEYIMNETLDLEIAVRVVRDVISDCNKLLKFPKLGAVLSEKVKLPTDYRYLVSGNYFVFYKIEESYISVYRVLHSKMDCINILFGNESTK